ncbi:putative Histone-lysine N-methyltransferase ATXR5 [Glycine max]|nr:putative Histone-lysine N-methyltransferase ATXR5 [Glycine max]
MTSQIIDFFGIWRSYGDANDMRPSRDAKKCRKHSQSLILHEKQRRLLPFVPTKDPAETLLLL